MSDPLSAFRFRVNMEKQEYGFSKLSGLQQERPTTVYQEGGLNDCVHIFPGPAKACGTVRLERGVYAGQELPFYLAGERLPKHMTIVIWNGSDRTKAEKCYRLSGLVVKKWEVGELDALHNTLLIDRFELDYESLSITKT